jgi:hypothetical protein
MSGDPRLFGPGADLLDNAERGGEQAKTGQQKEPFRHRISENRQAKL